jgi:hypothetical protein
MTSESEKVEGVKDAEQTPAAPKRKGMSSAFILLGIVFLMGTLLQHILAGGGLIDGERARFFSVVLGLVAFVATVGSGFRLKTRRFLASNRFAVPALLVLTGLSVLGTLILQNQPAEVLQKAYGPVMVAIIQGLFLNDMFHCFGFSVVMGLGAGGLALIISRKRKWTLRYAGSVGAHLGILLILAGAVVGNVWGVKGRLNMHVGQTADRFFVIGASGKVTEQPLGFSVRLDDFKLEHYEPDFRLMVFDVSGGKEKRLLSIDPRAKNQKELGEFGIKVMDYWPDHVRRMVVEPKEEADDPAAKRVSALGLSSPGAGKDENVQWVFDEGGPGGGMFDLSKQARAVFFLDEERARSFLESQKKPDTAPEHLLVVGEKRIPVEVGKTVSLPGTDHQVEVLRVFNDFVMDPQSKQPQNRSDRPDNPAIEVAIKNGAGEVLGKKWLFAKFPNFSHKEGDSPESSLGYVYTGGSRPRSVQAVLVGQGREIWRIRDGEIAAKEPFETGKEIKVADVPLVIREIQSSVVRSAVDETRSDKDNNPLAVVKVKGQSVARRIKPKQPVRFGEDMVLVLAPKGGETVRDYLSTLSVYQDGKKVLTSKVEVNYPLVHEGYAFFQSDYRPEDPTFSGFQVARDPGLWLVYLGLLINAAGVMCAMFLPAFLRRKKAGKVDGGKS